MDGILATFGEVAVYQEEAWNEQYDGREAVRDYYQALLAAVPDLQIDVQHRHVTTEAVILEVTLKGTHRGVWRGLPPTGRQIKFSLGAVYTFTADDKLAGERIYYDRATVFRQLGIFREPTTLAGRVTTALLHPLTIARAYTRWLRNSE